MKYKKVMLMTILLLAILTIGAVSATEVEDALAVDDSGDETVVEAPVDVDATQTVVADEEVMEASENSDDLGSSPNATFTELKSIIESAGAGTTVNLENDYLYDGSGSISISKQLTINGKGHTINGDSQSCAFVLTGKVTLENITFINCVGKYGGAISIDSSASNCNVRSCNFINCHGVETYGTYQNPNQGGAILNDGANTIIDSCTFRNCGTYDGGAVYSTSGCKITSCDFRDCCASNQGGAIHIGSDSFIESCNFINCACDNKGGAIFNAAQTCTINSCRFENCTAFTGNAIHNQAGKSKANKCRFVDLLEGQVGSGVEFTDCLFKDSADAKITDVDLVSGYNYGENAVVKVMTNVAGNLTVKVDNVPVNTTTIAANTFKSFDLGILDAGWHDVECILDAGSMYNTAKNGVGFGVNPKSTYVSVYTSESYVYGENVVVRVYANANGTIVLKVGEDVKNIKFNATQSVPVDLGVLGIGTHNFTANFTPDDVKNYEGSSKDGSFAVSSVQAKITYLWAKEFVYGENAVVNVKTNVGGNLTIKVGETTKVVPMVADELTPIDFGVMDSGSYNILANFTDGISSDSNNQMTLSISKAQSKITYSHVGRYYVYGDEVIVRVKTNVNGNLTVKVGNASYMELPIAANQLKNISLGVLDMGSYDVVVKLFAGKNYIPSNETLITHVLYKLEDKDVNITVPEVKTGSESIVVKLPSDATGTIRIILLDKNRPFGEIVDGVASYKVPSLTNGDYNYTIIYHGNDKYTNYTSSGILKVNVPVKTTLSASDVSTVYDGGKYLVATLKDNGGNAIKNQKLTVVIGSKTFNSTTDKNGQVKVSTDGLAPKDYYTASITFKGNANYAKSTKSVKVTVKKATPKLTAKAKTFKKSVKTKNYVVTFKTNTNKVMKKAKLTLKVNGKTYSATTNAKGQATFKITKLTKKGKFTAVVKFAGNKYYNAKTVNAKITVK